MTRHAAVIGAGAATVMEAKLSSWESYLALVLFCLLASASYLFMEICAVFKPGQTSAVARSLDPVLSSPEAPTDLHGTELGRRGEQTGRQ